MVNENELNRIKNKYYREIKLTKIRIIERSNKLTLDDISNLSYQIEPRNKAEDEIKENYMGFVGQRLLEGYSQKESLSMARICIDEAVNLAKIELLKKRRK